MAIRLMTISLLFLSFQGMSQTNYNSVLFDTVYISQVKIGGINIGSSIDSVKKSLGTPSYYFTGISEISEEKFSIYKFKHDSISLLFNNNDNLYYIEYFMANGYEFEIGDKKLTIGDNISTLKQFFPNSYDTYIMLKDKGAVGLFLKGKSIDGYAIGIDFNIVVRNNKIYSFSMIEEY